MSQFIPALVYENLYKMMGYRRVIPAAEMMESSAVAQRLNSHEFVAFSGSRTGDQRPDCEMVIVLIGMDSKYAQKSADFKKLHANILKQHTKRPIELIFVSPEGLTTHIKKYIAAFSADYPEILIEDLAYEIFLIESPKHVLVPKHELVPEEEVREFCDTFYTDRSEFPEIKSNEAQAIWLGIRPGMVVKITRPSETSGYTVAFKVCT